MGDLGKLIVALGFEKLPKVQKRPIWSHSSQSTRPERLISYPSFDFERGEEMIHQSVATQNDIFVKEWTTAPFDLPPEGGA